MNNRKNTATRFLCAAVIAAGALIVGSGTANAQDGILYKRRAGDSNYCHLKFPAIRPDTLQSGQPVLQNPNAGEIVDFYGPCNYDPTGSDAVTQQKHAQGRVSLQE